MNTLNFLVRIGHLFFKQKLNIDFVIFSPVFNFHGNECHEGFSFLVLLTTKKNAEAASSHQEVLEENMKYTIKGNLEELGIV